MKNFTFFLVVALFLGFCGSFSSGQVPIRPPKRPIPTDTTPPIRPILTDTFPDRTKVQQPNENKGHIIGGAVSAEIKATPRAILEPTPELYFIKLKCIEKNSRIKNDRPYFKLDNVRVDDFLLPDRSTATDGTEIYYEKSMPFRLPSGKTDWEVRLYEESDKYHLGTRKISIKDMGKGDKFGRFSMDTLPVWDNGNKSSYNSNPLERDWNYELKYRVLMNAGGILVHSVTGGEVKVENIASQLTVPQRNTIEIVHHQTKKVQKSPSLQLLWRNAHPQDEMILPVHLTAGTKELIVRMSSGPDSPIVQFYVGNKKVGRPIDLYSTTIIDKRLFDLGQTNYSYVGTGRYDMHLRIVDRNPRSTGNNVRFSSYEFSK